MMDAPLGRFISSLTSLERCRSITHTFFFLIPNAIEWDELEPNIDFCFMAYAKMKWRDRCNNAEEK